MIDMITWPVLYDPSSNWKNDEIGVLICGAEVWEKWTINLIKHKLLIFPLQSLFYFFSVLLASTSQLVLYQGLAIGVWCFSSNCFGNHDILSDELGTWAVASMGWTMLSLGWENSCYLQILFPFLSPETFTDIYFFGFTDKDKQQSTFFKDSQPQPGPIREVDQSSYGSVDAAHSYYPVLLPSLLKVKCLYGVYFLLFLAISDHGFFLA